MLKKIDPLAYGLVKKFYKETHYGGGPGRDETVWCWEEQGRWIACVRLQPKEDDWFLRAMVVHPDYRGAGVGRQFLNALVKRYRDANIYCFPFDHLEAFYAHAGFLTCELSATPDWFRDMYTRLIKTRNVIPMLLIPVA